MYDQDFAVLYVAAWVTIGLGALTLILISYFRWKKLKPQLFPESEKTAEGAKSTRNTVSELVTHPEPISRLLTEIHWQLREHVVFGGGSIEPLIDMMVSATGEMRGIIQSLVTSALASADLSSVMVRKASAYAYIVVVPNRHDNPQLLRRYAPFSGGLRHHLENVRNVLTSSGEFSALLAYLLFLSSDGSDSTLVAAYADAQRLLLPAVLVRRNELAGPGVESFDAHADLSKAA